MVGQVMVEYVKSPQYTFDVLSGKHNDVAYKLALKKINELSNKYNWNQRVRNQFKAFVRSDTRVLAKTYDWKTFHKKLKEEA